MIRYQIRNEYGLSDPELYAAPGEEDDPEVLLEGVAMAGLVGVLRQLGDLSEFAAEIFHDLHEDVMATASRGHGLMLRLQQLEAEFPVAEKAIISQTDHSNYPHDEGVEWHPNLQFRQNLITQGDMPRFILDSYEECRGPPHLFTLDKFDVAGAGASLKRYSDPSFFKTEHASNMIESEVIMEKKPQRIKKKAMRWRKGVTLEALLVANSESFKSTSKDRASRKVPPRTTKLKSRHPRSPDYKTISRICREHLQEVISSQQKIMSSCSARQYHVKFRSTDSSEAASQLEGLNNFGALQSSGKSDLSKVVPINESDTVDTTSAPTNASGHLEEDDKQCLGKQDGLTEFKEVSKKSPVEQNGMICDSEKPQECTDLLVGENDQRLQSARKSKFLLAASHADQDADGCRSDDIASDDNFVDALNSIDTEAVINPEMKAEQDPIATLQGNELNLRSKEGENASDSRFIEVGPAIESSPGLNVSCNIEEPSCLDSPLRSDSVPSTVTTTNGPNYGSPSSRHLNGSAISSNSVNHDHNSLLDGSSMSMGGPNVVSEDEEEINVGDADELFLHPTKSDEKELQDSEKDLAECESLDTGTFAAVPDKDSVVEPTPLALDPDDIQEHLNGIAPTHPNMYNNILYVSNDEEIIEDMRSLPDDDLSTPFNKHDTEDQRVNVLDERTCSTKLGTQKEVQSSAVAKDFANAQELPVVIQGESSSQDDREVYEEETPAPSSYVVNDDTESLNTGPCAGHHEFIEMENTLECAKIEVTEESTTDRFADGLIPPEEEITDTTKYSDKVEVLAIKENCRHDVQLQSISFNDELERVEATCRNLGAHDEIESAGETCSNNDAAHLPSSAHFPEESDSEEHLLEVASLNAEVLVGCNSSDKDDAVSLKNNAMEIQPANIDQDLAWGMATQDSSCNTVKKQPADTDQDSAWNLSAQDSSSTNPFMDPAYFTSHAQIHPSTMSYQPHFSEEEEDFLSELLVEHNSMGAASDSLWEPATPPEEAPLPSEVMTEEDFRSFCHEYHEINFTGDTDGCHGESASDSNNISNAVVVGESDWACSVSSQSVRLDHEAFNGSNFCSQGVEYSSATDAHADTSMSFSVRKDLEDEALEVDPQLKSQDSFSDIRNPELDMLSVPVGLQPEQHNSCGADSYYNKENMNEECCSPSSNVVAVKEELENHASLVPHSFVNENVDELDVLRSDAVSVEPEAGTHVLDEPNNKDVPFCLSHEFASPNDPPSSIDEDKDSPEASVLRTSFQVEQDSEYFPSCEHDSQIALSSSLDEKIVELEGHPLSNAVVPDQEPEVCVPCGLDSEIIQCSSTDEKICRNDCAPLSSSVLLDLDSEDHVLGDCDFQVTPCSLVKDKIDESEAAQQNSVLSEEQEQDAVTSLVLNSQVAPFSSNIDKNGSYEDLQKPPPLPPLQWRLGRPRLGLLNKQGCMPESARTADPIFPALSQEMDTGLGLLDRINRSLGPVTPEGIKENMNKSSVIGSNDRNVEFRRLSPGVTETDIPRLLSDASENSKQHEHMSLSTIGVEEHSDDNTRVISETEVEEHLEDSGITHGTDFYPTNPLLPYSTNEQQVPHLDILSSDTSEKSLRHTHPVASEEDRLVNDHNAAVDMASTSKEEHIYESWCYQQAEHRESLSENLEHCWRISNASEDNNIVKHQCLTSETSSDTTNHCAPESLLEEKNNQKHQTLQEWNLESSEESQLGGSLSIAESMATQDCLNDRYNSKREKINQPRGPGPVVGGLDEGSHVNAEQPPVMGWTVGPQMLHPNYGIWIKERPFEPNITDNHVIRKPISIRNIPRNPLVDAVAAHDRSSMRKVSELGPPADKPKPNERNLLLEQIRNKTFNLKPASSMPTAIRSPARADTRNLKVAAIIEKANAIRQAVGSDDEDGDNWSD
ncbi:hypothetical protein PR202_ga13926 [Eleusine coracana subsp. coracana]|uniref:WH2 domain-containing protein n=1 Tax=Eleusine coracana subsp. coracana TaxID=191504 RepID=A0AAV5CF97_ELECO|nr:hypothetical protein PR202_ga13926 [Eleusine coracana subsp. coracana]